MKLYTKTVCPKCLLVKAELNRVGLTPEILNIDQNEHAKEELLSAGFLAVPVLQIDDEWLHEVPAMLEKVELLAQ
ncbi:MAG: glutaredoxin [Solibacillus sp.]